jgi:hypothetical protein
MNDIKELKELDQVLSEVIDTLMACSNSHNVYWHSVKEIIDAASRLREMVREFIRNEETE